MPAFAAIIPAITGALGAGGQQQAQVEQQVPQALEQVPQQEALEQEE